MDRVLRLTYASSLTGLCEINSSFDTGVLRIAYTGQNKNGSYISKEAFERCVKTMYNCPIVCNYDRDSDTFGGHDIEVVRDDDGSMRLVNLTTPVGCIPESAKYWFETFEEDDGSEHEYLCAEVLIWKRQEAYQKIKRDGVAAHSMELNVKSGHTDDDGLFHIEDFEFTAFALIGVNPCFEGSALELFSQVEFKAQMSEMMRELKETFQLVTASKEDDNIHPQEFPTEGGEEVLEKENEIVDQIEEIADKPVEESFAEPEAAPVEEPETQPAEERFALTQNIMDELYRMLSEQTIRDEYGYEYPRYWMADCDFDLCEVYCWDHMDWLLYGFTYEINGDSIRIDYDSKKRMKYVIAPWDGGEQGSPFADVYAQMTQEICDKAAFEQKCVELTEAANAVQAELDELRQFKADAVASAESEARDAVFALFEDLVGNEAFEALREHAAEYDTETLEEKCYAIRGRTQTVAKFSLENKTNKLVVDKSSDDDSNEPYGGLFLEYGAKG